MVMVTVPDMVTVTDTAMATVTDTAMATAKKITENEVGSDLFFVARHTQPMLRLVDFYALF